MSSGTNVAPPDYTPLANASEKAAQVMQNLGQQQIDLAKQQYSENEPTLQAIAQQQIDIGNQNAAAAAKLQQDQAQALNEAENYNTDSNQALLASQAGGDQAQAASNNQASLARQMAAMGVNPNSGKFAALTNANAVSNAASAGAAMTGARNQAYQTGFANLLSASGQGGGSSGAYGVALNAGNSASANTMAPGNALLNGVGAGASTIGNGLGMRLNGLGNILNSQTSLYGTSMNNSASLAGAGIGAVAGIAGAFL